MSSSGAGRGRGVRLEAPAGLDGGTGFPYADDVVEDVPRRSWNVLRPRRRGSGGWTVRTMPAVLVVMVFGLACAPGGDDGYQPDAHPDIRDDGAGEADAICDRARCNSRCVAAGYTTGECRENGSCACGGSGCDDAECRTACAAVGYPEGACRPTGACGCSSGSDAGTPPPAIVERCNDFLDNDEDGLVDEDCPCVLGTHQGCYTGPQYTRNIGQCRDGVQRCVAEDGPPHWGPCEGGQIPVDESCDGLDNDCNFIVDDGCGECVPTEFGVETSCTDSTDNDCDGMADCFDPDCPPCCREETCGDGIDNDCNDLIDEYCDRPCTPGEYFSIADCRDAIDNDCDGLTDCDDLDCLIVCCTAESCGDRIDNDCDGLTDCADPDCGASCCSPVEACADGTDNDCDGAADCEDPDCCSDAACAAVPPCCADCCLPGTRQRCYMPRYCSSWGWQDCKPDGRWGTCFEA